MADIWYNMEFYITFLDPILKPSSKDFVDKLVQMTTLSIENELWTDGNSGRYIRGSRGHHSLVICKTLQRDVRARHALSIWHFLA